MNYKMVCNFILILSLGLLISGCFDLEERIVLNKDGSGTLEVEYWEMKDMNIDDDTFRLPGKEADIRKEVEKKYTSNHVKLTDFKVEESKNSQYVHFKVTFDNILDLNKVPQFQDNEIQYRKSGKTIEFTRIVFFDTKTSKKDEPENMFENFVLGLVEEGLSKIKFRFEIETPYEINHSNADWTPGDKRAVWRYKLSDVLYKTEIQMKLSTK